MYKLFLLVFSLLLLLPFTDSIAAQPVQENVSQDQGSSERRVLTVPNGGNRRRKIRSDRRRSRGIGSAFSKAGKSAGRGGAGFGKGIAKGSKELGKGMGGFGKHTGKGMARIGKRIGKTFTN
jgi:hypothetical protein